MQANQHELFMLSAHIPRPRSGGGSQGIPLDSPPDGQIGDHGFGVNYVLSGRGVYVDWQGREYRLETAHSISVAVNIPTKLSGTKAKKCVSIF